MSEHKTIAEAATDFLASLNKETRDEYRQELNKFIRWCGTERRMQELRAPEVAKYAENIDSAAEKRIPPIKAFLTYAKKAGLVDSNLAVHLRPKKTIKRSLQRSPRLETAKMTAEGYRMLQEELESLKNERPNIAEAIRKAAADKDFRENAPLEAAKEHQGMVEARIRELEAVLKSAAVTTETTDSSRISLGSTVILHDLVHKGKLRYQLVNSREANPLNGKLSVESPTGKALVNRRQGEEVEVIAPAGTLRYRIETIEG